MEDAALKNQERLGNGTKSLRLTNYYFETPH
jgi:hypothetical protein